MADTRILRTILESTRKVTSKYRVSGPFSIKEAAVAIPKLDDWSMTQATRKIKSYIGKFKEQLELRHVEPHAYERGYRAGEGNSPITTTVMTNFNSKLMTERQRLAFCAGWAATFNNADTLKESACPACEEELEEEEVLIFEDEGMTRGGKKVILNRPFRTPNGPKKFAVYVRKPINYTKNSHRKSRNRSKYKGNVVRVSFGDPKMEIKRDNPTRRKSYRSRHGCESPGPKWKANYWSCRMWGRRNVSSIAEAGFTDNKRMCDNCYSTVPTGASKCRSCGSPVSRGGAQVKAQQRCKCGHSQMMHDPQYGCADCNCKKFEPMPASTLREDEEQMGLFDQNVVILHQMAGAPDPSGLKAQPIKWSEFLADVKRGEYGQDGFMKPEIKRVPNSFFPDKATAVYREGPDGNVEVWKMNWDSSG